MVAANSLQIWGQENGIGTRSAGLAARNIGGVKPFSSRSRIVSTGSSSPAKRSPFARAADFSRTRGEQYPPDDEIAGGPARLRPHVKTHKLAPLVRIQREHGITKFKCATIAEAEMTAAAGALDVMLAFPLVGPSIERLIELQRRFPETRFSSIADDQGSVRALGAAAARAGLVIEVLLDIDCGMHRTGLPPGDDAARLYRLIAETDGLQAGGLHAYDGHIKEPISPRRAQ